MENCKHGMIKECCSTCSGFLEIKQAAYDEKQQQVKGEKYKLSSTYYQAESLKTADRFNEPIQDSEIKLLLERTDESGVEKKVLFDLAVYLGRTFNALVWWYKIMYHADKFKEGHHADTTMARFKKFQETVTITT